MWALPTVKALTVRGSRRSVDDIVDELSSRDDEVLSALKEGARMSRDS